MEDVLGNNSVLLDYYLKSFNPGMNGFHNEKVRSEFDREKEPQLV